MDRRQFLTTASFGALALAGAPMINLGRCRLEAAPAIEVSTRAVELVRESTVIDMLGLLTLDWKRLASWRRQPERFDDADFRDLERSGVDIFHPAVETGHADPFEGALHWIKGWNRLLGDRRCYFARIDRLTDLVHAPAVGRIGILLGFQNATHFRSAADVGRFFGLGQRVSQLTYNGRNRLGGGCYVSDDPGLSRFGAEVVAEMNRVGMAIDVSHCGERTSLDAVRASRHPVLITHANCRELNPHPRCKTDRVIRETALRGGVMGITVVRAFVGRGRAPSLDDVLDHFDHVARIAGIEHVGLGSDVDLAALDPSTGRPNPAYEIRGLAHPARAYQITDGLLRRGYTPDHLRQILGGNFLRALAAILPDDEQPLRSEETLRDPFCPAPNPELPAGLTPIG